MIIILASAVGDMNAAVWGVVGGFALYLAYLATKNSKK
jgi:hypothetical protein